MLFKGFYKYIKNFLKKEEHMGKKIKKYKVSPNESLCLAVSVVDKPAVESEFIYLSEQKQENFVAVEKQERRMIYGCALRADFPIYRNNGKEEYYLEFDSQAIDKISKDFMKNGFQSNWTAGHQSEVEGLTVTEIWLKESPTLDKSIAVGLDASIPVGSLFLGCYCENDEVWNAVKEGKYNGFSIEALVGLEEFEKQIETEEIKEETVELEEEKPAEAPVSQEETPKVEEKPAEEPKVEETPKVEEEVKEEEKPVVDNTAHLEELINSLKEEITALKDMNTGLNKKVKELSKQPSVAPVNTNAKPSAADTYSQWREQMRQMI